MQQGVQTDATCNIQQCWELLANNVASVCTRLYWGERYYELHQIVKRSTQNYKAPSIFWRPENSENIWNYFL